MNEISRRTAIKVLGAVSAAASLPAFGNTSSSEDSRSFISQRQGDTVKAFVARRALRPEFREWSLYPLFGDGSVARAMRMVEEFHGFNMHYGLSAVEYILVSPKRDIFRPVVQTGMAAWSPAGDWGTDRYTGMRCFTFLGEEDRPSQFYENGMLEIHWRLKLMGVLHLDPNTPLHCVEKLTDAYREHLKGLVTR